MNELTVVDESTEMGFRAITTDGDVFEITSYIDESTNKTGQVWRVGYLSADGKAMWNSSGSTASSSQPYGGRWAHVRVQADLRDEVIASFGDKADAIESHLSKIDDAWSDYARALEEDDNDYDQSGNIFRELVSEAWDVIVSLPRC